MDSQAATMPVTRTTAQLDALFELILDLPTRNNQFNGKGLRNDRVKITKDPKIVRFIGTIHNNSQWKFLRF